MKALTKQVHKITCFVNISQLLSLATKLLLNGPIYQAATVAGMEAILGLNNIDNIEFPSLRLIWSQLCWVPNMPTAEWILSPNMTVSRRAGHPPGESWLLWIPFVTRLLSWEYTHIPDIYLHLCLQNYQITKQELQNALLITLVYLKNCFCWGTNFKVKELQHWAPLNVFSGLIRFPREHLVDKMMN